MTEEDEEFNRIEREASLRMEAVTATVSKREWVGLTLEEIDAEWGKFMSGASDGYVPTFVRAIETKLREKNGM
jgi:hypothetical protein